MKILIWNTEWAKPNSKREKIIKEIVKNASPDIICITEGYLESWQDFGHTIASDEDYGYKIHQGRRKVILISKTPWSNNDDASTTNIPEGRYISGNTRNIDVIGVCIPWKDAHVRTGKKDKQVWEDHISYLEGLHTILSNFTQKTLIMGDFNQRLPNKYARKDAFDLMLKTFDNFKFETKDNIQPIDKQSIDHLCTKNQTVTSIESIDNFQDDVRLSDHFGLIIEIDDSANLSNSKIDSNTIVENNTVVVSSTKNSGNTNKNNFREKFKANHRAVDGHMVRSKAEMLIDNWLYAAEIVHAYERKLPIKEEVYCDFYIPTKKIYIEYWGLENDPKYAKRKAIKKNIYKKYDFTLVELTDDDIFNLDDVLPKMLLEHGVKTY